VEPGGYAWWYVDALSDDGRHALTLIAFIGSVFSPYYALARRRGAADPRNFCSINVALYGAGGKRWCMTERGRSALDHSAHHIAVGPSRLEWTRDGLAIDIEEWAVPVPRRVKGRILLRPEAVMAQEFSLDVEARHIWQPIAPHARVEVSFTRPQLSWSGSAYFDHNRGCEPLETGFKCWNWSRSAGGPETSILYDAMTRDGRARRLGLRVSSTGAVSRVDLPPRTVLPTTLWGIRRASASDGGVPARLIKTLEDTPFYARSLVAANIAGREDVMFHESLDLDRFANPLVQAMLPFRMPRRVGR
jgi:carotenoid 1,2-hydratase